MEFLELLFGLIITVLGFKVLLVSSEIVDERKQRYRDGTHDYYGNKIEDE